MKLEDRIAVVTGAAQGLGRACALALAEAGAAVVLADIRAEANEAAAREIAERTSRPTLAVPTDVSDPAQAEALIRRAVERFGRIDILINNAGIMATGDILTGTIENFDRVLAVNLRGAFLVGQQTARAMVERRTRGSIVNMSSVNAVIASGSQLPYAVSKGGIGMLTRAMAVGLAEHGIRVNAIGPGTIDTDLIRPVMVDENAKRMLLSRTPLRRLGDPAEVAKVALFLASDDSSYITGQTIYPDGGRLALNYTVPVDA